MGWAKVIVVNFLVIAAILAGSEWLCSYLYRHPNRAPHPFLAGIRHYYTAYDRNIPQVDPACARYDKELAYTLRPGDCSFVNLEFATELRINSLGVRDDEESLAAPEVIVLGDSYAMGWGVGQVETFAQVLERMTGKKVLNLGVSSYGTARELLLLQRADRSNLRVLVIQYCANDYPENKSFEENDHRLPVSSPAEFDRIYQNYRQRQQYFFGKYTLRLLPAMLRFPIRELFFSPQEDEITDHEEAALFVRILDWFQAWDEAPRLIVFETNDQPHNDGRFIAALREVLLRTERADRTATLDTATFLTPDDYFLVDDHLRASGHTKIAARLASLMHDDQP